MTDYELVLEEISAFLGTPQARWDGRTKIDVESAVRKGINAVVHNLPGHQWSWMRPSHRFQTADGQRRYTLPLDFEQFINAIYFDGESYTHDEITQLPSGRLAQMYNAYNNTGVPTNYALEVLSHDGTTEQNQQLVLHPTPDGTYTLVGPYQVGPIRRLTTARPWFPGGPENRELFIASCLAAVESKFLDGPVTDKQDQFQGALVAAIGRDYKRQPRNLGYLGPGRPGRNRDSFRWKTQTQYNGGLDV